MCHLVRATAWPAMAASARLAAISSARKSMPTAPGYSACIADVVSSTAVVLAAKRAPASDAPRRCVEASGSRPDSNSALRGSHKSEKDSSDFSPKTFEPHTTINRVVSSCSRSACVLEVHP